MRWRVSLAGEQPDLFSLVRMFPMGTVYVVQDDDGTYLMGPGLDVETQAGEAYQLAERWLRQINGAATALRSGDYWHVALGDRICDADAPQNVYVMAGAATAVARALSIAEVQVIDADGQVVPPPPSPGPDILSRSMNDPALAEALRWMGTPGGPDWAHLWKAFEMLRYTVGDTSEALSKRCGVTLDEIGSFRSSANHPTISGDMARHSAQKHPPASPVNLDQGRDFVGRLIQAW